MSRGIEELSGIHALGSADLASVPAADAVQELDGEPPAYRALYYRWEREQWQATAIDLDGDANDWTRRLFPEQRRAVLWLLAASTAGEEQLSRTLVAFVDAALSEEQGVFLTTQLADAGRHTVLYERLGEALSSLDMGGGALSEIEPGRALLGYIAGAAEALRIDRDAAPDLVKGVAAQHLLLQGVSALTARVALIEWLQGQGAMPGLVRGLMAVTRDEIRHVQFGLRFLSEVGAAGSHRKAFEAALEETAPFALAILGSGGDELETVGLSGPGLRDAGVHALARRLAVAGIAWEPPAGEAAGGQDPGSAPEAG